jgi:hypothetical protein
MKKLTTGTSSIFINPMFTIQINPTLEINAEMQVICYLGKDGWSYDDIMVSDVTEIRYSGFTISDYAKMNAFITHHKEIGIDLWSIVSDEAEKAIREHSVEVFIEVYSPLQISK